MYQNYITEIQAHTPSEPVLHTPVCFALLWNSCMHFSTNRSYILHYGVLEHPKDDIVFITILQEKVHGVGSSETLILGQPQQKK